MIVQGFQTIPIFRGQKYASTSSPFQRPNEENVGDEYLDTPIIF